MDFLRDGRILRKKEKMEQAMVQLMSKSEDGIAMNDGRGGQWRAGLGFMVPSATDYRRDFLMQGW